MAIFEVKGSTKRALMKIDVEGAEDDVLLGATQFLATYAPDILCEILPEAATSTVERALQNQPYRYFLMTDQGLKERERLAANILDRDWLFTTKSDADLKQIGVQLVPIPKT